MASGGRGERSLYRLDVVSLEKERKDWIGAFGVHGVQCVCAGVDRLLGMYVGSAPNGSESQSLVAPMVRPSAPPVAPRDQAGPDGGDSRGLRASSSAHRDHACPQVRCIVVHCATLTGGGRHGEEV